MVSRLFTCINLVNVKKELIFSLSYTNSGERSILESNQTKIRMNIADPVLLSLFMRDNEKVQLSIVYNPVSITSLQSVYQECYKLANDSFFEKVQSAIECPRKVSSFHAIHGWIILKW